jgi:hypothetical protein
VEGASQSKLDPRIQDIIRIFFDVQAIKKTLAEMDIDLEKMPLGKVDSTTSQCCTARACMVMRC